MVAYTQDGHIALASLEVSVSDGDHRCFLDPLTYSKAFAWTMTAITILFSAGRYAITAVSKKRIQWDGVTHLLALLAMIAMVGLFQSLFHDGYYITAIQKKLLPQPSQQMFVEIYVRFKKRSNGIALLFFTSTWLVKISFLLFYRGIFEINKNFRRAWWAVLTFVFVTYWVTVAGVLTQCGPTQNSYSLGRRANRKGSRTLLSSSSGMHQARKHPIWQKALEVHLCSKCGHRCSK